MYSKDSRDNIQGVFFGLFCILYALKVFFRENLFRLLISPNPTAYESQDRISWSLPLLCIHFLKLVALFLLISLDMPFFYPPLSFVFLLIPYLASFVNSLGYNVLKKLSHRRYKGCFFPGPLFVKIDFGWCFIAKGLMWPPGVVSGEKFGHSSPKFSGR